eukprot:TRINITY_DN22094_c1_g1_i1.p1 TRINITY_DN22094_c1_g1~~TRINITY_DN22094_c1_g1_i1.p1  ORF type:complete len:558 (-),score=48.54 TRINITY_DN22094_c1_g1_i1:42-1715(-)
MSKLLAVADVREMRASSRRPAALSKEILAASRAIALSKFEIAHRSLLRATQAKYPLGCCGAALRQRTQLRPPSIDVGEANNDETSNDFHPWSHPASAAQVGCTENHFFIREFWSHSWHDAALPKVIVLLLEYNGLAATIAGTATAFVASGLYAVRVLPAVLPERLESDYALLRHHNVWGTTLGVLSFVSTLLAWPSRRNIFLDKICISQVNEKKKLDAVIGIGGFLKVSKCMLVIIDSTYLTRLWCIFEIAAYSKLMEDDPRKSLRIKPLAFGNMFIALFAGAAAWTLSTSLALSASSEGKLVFVLEMAVYFTVFHNLRRYQDLSAKVRGQLLKFSMEASECFCCQVDHVHPDSGETLLCDRQAVNACVNAWFGSSESFNAFVQHSLYDRLKCVSSNTHLPYGSVLMAELPLLWNGMDMIAEHLRKGSWHDAQRYAFSFAANIFITGPLCLACFCALAHSARRRLSSPYVDVAVSLSLPIVFAAVDERLRTFHICPFYVERGGETGWAWAVCALFLGILTSLVYGFGVCGFRVHGCPCQAWTSSSSETGMTVEMAEA